jgi:cytochrome P450 RapN
MPDEIVDYPIVEATRLDVDPLYRELQTRGPIKVKLPFGEPCWLATRYDDVRTVYGDRRFGRRLGLDHDAPGLWPGARVKDPALLVNMDPPEHTRLRRLAHSAFTPNRVRALEPFIREVVGELVGDMAQQGPGVDFVSTFSTQLPVLVLAHMTGVAKDDANRFRSIVEVSSAMDSSPEDRERAHQRLRQEILALISDRRARPTDDLLSTLVSARDEQDGLSEAELFDLCLALWHGGFKTTLMQLGTTLFTLLTHPAHWQELVDDHDLLPAAIEELFRWIPSFKYGVPFVRWASEDVELSGGVVVRAGEPALPEFSVANRDESVYPKGWELDFHRASPAPHLSFAFGAHRCIGAHLATLQVKLAVEALLHRFPTLRLAIAEDEVTFSKSSFMRSVETMPVAW